MVSGSLPEVRCGIGAYSGRLASALAAVPGVSVQLLTTRNALVRPELVSPAQVLEPMDNWALPAVVAALHRARRERPDIVHFQYPAVGYARSLGVLALPYLARLRLRVPVVSTIHEWRVRAWHGRLATDLVAVSSDLVIVPDRLEAAELRDHLRRFRTRVEVADMISTISVSSPTGRAAARAQLGLPPDGLVIGTFGLIQPRHRLEDIVEALAVLRERGVESHFLIIGGEAEYDADVARQYASEVRRRIEQRQLTPHVTWTGYRPEPEVSTALRACDVCVLLYPEGASARNTTLQAVLEHGVPAVTTDGPATSAELRQTAGLRLLPAAGYRAEDLADAISAAAGEAGQQPAAAPMLQNQVARHLQLYRQLLPGALVPSQTA
jgi:glycosyltransferase involved in cell wall biosynthesis